MFEKIKRYTNIKFAVVYLLKLNNQNFVVWGGFCFTVDYAMFYCAIRSSMPF